MTEFEVDQNTLPQRALLDTNIVILALGDRPTDPRAPACRAFWEMMIECGRDMLIAAPTLAEIVRYSGKPVPRRKGVEVVAFDSMAAQLLGKHFPQRFIETEANAAAAPKAHVKYDALIASCALRHKAGVLVSYDANLGRLVLAAGLGCKKPEDFRKQQLTIPGT